MRQSMQALKLFTVVAVFTILERTNGNIARNTPDPTLFLSKYGYLPTSAHNPRMAQLHDANTWTKALKDSQNVAGLNATGEQDDETMQLMSLPRCGVHDEVDFGTNKRTKRYGKIRTPWPVMDLTYKISKYPKRLDADDVDAVMARAFALWSEHTDLTFTQKSSGTVDIEIKFVKGAHGCDDDFDGWSVAHSYFPSQGGDVHFDDAQQWAIDSSDGISLLEVAAHEFGHSLGLSHSLVSSSLMYTYNDGQRRNTKLAEDDIRAIQGLYGTKTKRGGGGGVGGVKNIPKNLPKRPASYRPTICEDPKIDAIFYTPEGLKYAFKGDKYYQVNDDRLTAAYPKYISEGWPGLPSDIEAAFTNENDKTFFFKAGQYWRYSGHEMDAGYPRNIRVDFPHIPSYLDAAMMDGKYYYFFKDSKYYRYDPTLKKTSYPQLISSYWKNLPNNLDAVLSFGLVYFFKGDKYFTYSFDYEINDPRPTGKWFGCHD